MGGVAAGIFVFGEIFPFITDFFYSTHLGKVTLPDFLNLSYGMVVFLVVLMALGAFAAAEWGERKMAKKGVTGNE